ncbi:hypothetical protein EIK77_008970 [Talaromyces pinophilus]|jgi:hypothetical protein|nr:hypothetical protein EIK77_008970 [Talaromyces pinophilus]PCG98067.1 Hypothetical protein PENO1_059810 [Penicillium occitanis (nom. inval.)]PCH01700.1 hypothetical protein PENOC_046800 [Penicillium occitanis (nom. inval.)]
MATQEAKYLRFPVIKEYLENTFKPEDEDEDFNPLQSPCDTIFQKILDCYFTIEDDFMTETQGYPDSGQDRTKYNIAVKTLAHDQLETVLIVEAKRFPRRTSTWKNVTEKCWTNPKKQLQEYMRKANDNGEWGHTMYGIVMLGDHVHFLQRGSTSDTLKAYESEVLSRAQKSTLSIRDDDVLLEEVLLEILEKVKRDRQRRRGLRP